MFRTVRGFASPGTDFPGYPHAPSLPPESRALEEHAVPRLRVGNPSPVHSMEDPEKNRIRPRSLPSGNCRQHYPWRGFPPGIALTALAPGGRERSAGEWGLPEGTFRCPFCPGGTSPLPVPSPWRYPTVHSAGRSGGEPDRALSPRTARPGGAGWEDGEAYGYFTL